MKTTYLSMLFILFMSVQMLHAQDDAKAKADTLVGLVVNQKGKAMKNVSVTYNGKEMQQTNKKGLFIFPDVSSLNDTLTLVLPKSRIWQIPASGMSFLKITVQDKDFSVGEAKDEIINLGYGTAKKRTNTSDVTTISGDDLRRGGSTDLTRALIGRVAGLRVVRDENGEMKLVIRGGAPSFEIKDNSALLVLDGMIVDSFDNVDIFSVESVTVMKQATIYGMRGSNGAVIVTTK